MGDEKPKCSLVQSRCQIFEALAAKNSTTYHAPISSGTWKYRYSNPDPKPVPANNVGTAKESDVGDKRESLERLDNVGNDIDINVIIVDDVSPPPEYVHITFFLIHNFICY